MAGEIVKTESNNMMQRSIADIRNNADLIRQLLKEVLKPGIHYDKPYKGAEKESLLKAGAEKILSTFIIGVRLKITDMRMEDEIAYRVIAEAFHIPTGTIMGEGVGECSSMEKKYKWVKAVCDSEYETFDPARKQIAWKKGKNGRPDYQEKQVRANPADVCNTVLKMAKKRAVTDVCLSVTAASDVFSVDVDTSEEYNRENLTEQEQPGNPISEPQAKRLFAILSGKDSKKTQDEFKTYLAEKYGLNSSREIDRADYETIINWIEGK